LDVDDRAVEVEHESLYPADSVFGCHDASSGLSTLRGMFMNPRERSRRSRPEAGPPGHDTLSADVFQPLAGIRVVDLTSSIAGPYCGLILGGLGADVVKLEHPERGDDARSWGPPFWNGESAAFLAMNAGKRSLGVDVKSPEGANVVHRLVERADVFVQSVRPGLAERLGFGFDALSARNPRLVYCTIGAFGAAGPRSEQPGYDPLMQAAGGIMSVTGEAGRPPVRAGISAVDQGTGMWAAIAILAALANRDAVGRAQLIDTSLFETAVSWVPYQVAGYLGTGKTPRPMGSGMNMLAPYEAFRARDGWLMLAAANDRLFASLCEALGAPERAHEPRFRTNADRVEHREELAAILGELVAREDVATWLVRLEAAGVPAAPVQDIAQVVADEQTTALGLLQPLDHPAIPDLRLVGLPLSFDGERIAYRSPPPALGEHSAEILREVGCGEDEIAVLGERGIVRLS
jgi:crotonobetainyl-CoA:carnitine CoA-transferase CaiB-like acyl-CoA transferase